jgi:hypothetical protein
VSPIAGRFDAGQAGGRAFGAVAGDLDLAGEGMHVRREARLGVGRQVGPVGGGVFLGLVQEAGEVLQAPAEGRDRNIVKGNGHAAMLQLMVGARR